MEPQLETLPPVPGPAQHLAGVPELSAAWEHQVAARRAESAKVTHLLAYRDRCAARVVGEPAVVRAEADKAAIRDAATMVGLSERLTTTVLNLAGFARQTLPCMWGAFTEGLVDLPRVRKVAEAAVPELNQQAMRELDVRAAEEAALRRTGDFHRWLTRFTAELDPEAYATTCERAVQDRYVRFQNNPNGMSYLEAYLPTLEAAAIQKRLRAAARGLDSPPAHDPYATQHTVDAAAHPDTGDNPAAGDGRTLPQREADLLAAWLRDGRVYTAPVEAKIMVMVPEATLTGESEEPGVAADRSWRVSAGQVRALARDPQAEHQWYQGRVRRNRKEADFDLLSARYVGRYPPQRLRDALIFRDGACQAPGCTLAAERCDIDHQQPWHTGGETTAENLWALCRRHHRMKSHGHLSPPRRHIPAKSPPRSGMIMASMNWPPTPITVVH
ncbi:HNH endonuclease signature motif containing protein [Nesterenkonia natronophila]|uniref:HNH endonuclease n=1 Tax=Nesterenkonia natronophila TaxID=2174932 RepID=A0A3A4F5N0_9MICC|nr:HNH endonuclease signature motif containing protein [Nesterenkonia natronophila]RJN33046.1 HNH endonuclease [Nesterenkonia natronophila]